MEWCVGSLRVSVIGIGLTCVALGAFSARWPQQSIGLYQAIMRAFNWRVAPIDERREIATTRVLGWTLVGLGLVSVWIARR